MGQHHAIAELFEVHFVSIKPVTLNLISRVHVIANLIKWCRDLFLFSRAAMHFHIFRPLKKGDVVKENWGEKKQFEPDERFKCNGILRCRIMQGVKGVRSPPSLAATWSKPWTQAEPPVSHPASLRRRSPCSGRTHGKGGLQRAYYEAAVHHWSL